MTTTVMKHCPSCNLDKEKSEYYSRTGICKLCHNIKTYERWKQNKIKWIEYKGGKCVDCKGVFDYYLYDFHHLNPEEKEFKPNRLRFRRWELAKKELDKCVLLCCMCHRIREYKIQIKLT